MNIEVSPELQRRAAKYAALADATRLRIVDLLALGDLTPTQLQAETGAPSNLLAHHVGVLEAAGIVRREKSEADRRRSYVRLQAEALPVQPGLAFASARRVVFVCTANSARSQLAAALWSERSDIPATSAGTHPAAHVAPGAVAVAQRHGLEFNGTEPRELGDLMGSDLVVTVCDAAHEELHLGHGLHWSVPDPVRVGTDTAFDAAFEDIARRIEAVASRVQAA